MKLMSKRKIDHENIRAQINGILQDHSKRAELMYAQWVEHANEFFDGSVYDLIETAVNYWITENPSAEFKEILRLIYTNTTEIKTLIRGLYE